MTTSSSKNRFVRFTIFAASPFFLSVSSVFLYFDLLESSMRIRPVSLR